MIKFSLFSRKPAAECPAAQANEADIAGQPTTAQTDSSQSASPANEPQSPQNQATPRRDDDLYCRVHNLIILDESGSMHSIYRPALSGVNETLQTIRAAQTQHPSQEHFVTLVTFDSNPGLRYNEIYRDVPADKAVDITENEYNPCGCTPLYDAMGRAINDLQQTAGNDDVVIVTIITDGYENASQEFTGKAIFSLVEKMRTKGWVFTYIGANQDVEQVAKSMNISNFMSFDADEEGTEAMFAKERASRKRFFSRINLSSAACRKDMCANENSYFDE